MKRSLVICNWKSYFSHQKLVQWWTAHGKDLMQLSHSVMQSGIDLVIAPSFEDIFFIQQNIRESALLLAAQDCSAWPTGAHTGSVSAQSLKELGCDYTLVGHSERRIQLGESTELISKKYAQAVLANLTPILCIGESEQERAQNKTETILEAQLASITTDPPGNRHIIIAYEPVWAIGTGQAASPQIIQEALQSIKTIAAGKGFAGQTVSLLYGGSVTAENIVMLNQAPLDGFLIGKTSTNFQELKKIVSFLEKR